MEKLTQDEKLAIIGTAAPAYKVWGTQEIKDNLRAKRIIGLGGGLTEFGKILRQRIMDQMLGEML